MKGKKGVVESQFNWIFVFIVGAAILLFFVGFIRSQHKQTEQQLGEKIAKDMNTIITQTSISIGKSDIVKLPGTSISFSCIPETCNKQGCTSEFTITDSNVGWPTPVQVLFTPDEIKGNSLVSWALGWNMPYHTTNFLYLTTPEIRYIFMDSDSDNPEIRKLFNEAPELMNKDLIRGSEPVFFQNNYKVRYIYYDDTITSIHPALSSMQSGTVTAVRFVPVPGAEETGEVTFYTNKMGDPYFKEAGKSYYLGRPSIFGAIFSENKEMYECNMKKAFIRLYLATSMYFEVMPAYKNHDKVSDICKSYYEDMSSIAQIGIASQTLDLNQAVTIYENAAKVKELNHDLKIYTCPLIY